MPRRLASLLAAGAVLLGWAGSAAAAPVTAGAREAVLYEPATGRFLLSRSGDREVAVGSLVKLMTARLAIESGDPARLITVPVTVTALPETKAGLVPGQRLSLSTLLAALLIRSANDAAVTIATALAGGEPAFARSMNAEAARMGLQETRYVDSSGLDAPGQWSSAHDVALLAASDLDLPGFGALVARPSVTMPGGQVYRTVNPFLAFFTGATGVKTGFTSEAMFCLAASADRGGRTLIAVVLGEPSWASADEDASALLEWGYGIATGPSPASTAPPATGASPVSSTPPASQRVPGAPPQVASSAAASPGGSGAAATVSPTTGEPTGGAGARRPPGASPPPAGAADQAVTASAPPYAAAFEHAGRAWPPWWPAAGAAALALAWTAWRRRGARTPRRPPR